VGAVVEIDAVPRSAVLAAQPLALQHECLLTGGDDYELVFTALPERRAAVTAAAAHAAVAVTRIGHIESGSTLRVVDRRGAAVTSRGLPFDHFRS
jgi:thiamine-monophosphate kinase